MNNSSNNPKSRHLLKPARIVFIMLGIIFLLGACTTPEPPVSQVVIISPTPPPPSATPSVTPQTPTPTPYPEDTISLPLYGSDPERIKIIETWALELSQATGLNLILVPAPETEMGLLEALRDGRIHMAGIDPLTYLVGNEQGWVEPGPIMTVNGQEAQAIVFVSRTDTGFLPGEPPQVFQQLEGQRACWPETEALSLGEMYLFGLPSYILPLGLLQMNEVENVWPVIKEGDFPDVVRAVFFEQCEFAAVPASSLFTDSSELEDNMQILFTTEPIYPYYSLYVFSSTLPEDVREQLSLAILANPNPYDSEYNPFNETLYDEFRRIVLASELDLQSFLSAPVDEP